MLLTQKFLYPSNGQKRELSGVSISSFFNLSDAGQLTLGGVITAATSASNDWMAYPFTMLIPSAIVIALTVACYYIGFSLADATDPRNHR